PGDPYLGGFKRLFMNGIVFMKEAGKITVSHMAVTIPETVYAMFQLTFAIITSALIAGSFAERMKFSAMLWFMGIWSVAVYPQIATAAAALGWVFTEWTAKGNPSVLGIASGAVAGLVAITPASGFVAPTPAVIIGAAAGILCFMASTSVKKMLGYDDSLDVFGVHCIGGIVGALLTGVFVSKAISGSEGSVRTQLWGVGATLIYG